MLNKFTLVSSAMGLSGSESLPHCEKEVGEPTSEAGGVGSSFFTSVTLSTSMATRSLRDSEERSDRKMSRAVSGLHCVPEVKTFIQNNSSYL